MTERFFGSHANGAGAEQQGGARPLAEEMMRLMSSVQDWAQGWAERNRGESGDGHTSSDCQWCPLCQFVAVLRGERPEVTERVAEAGTALAAALRALAEAASSAASAAAAHRNPHPPPAPRVQRINLGDEA